MIQLKQTMAAALWVAKEVGVKKGKSEEKKEPWWKRRIESDITNLRKNINRLKRESRGETGGNRKRKIKGLNAKYRVKKKGINLVTEELRQRLIAKKTKVKNMNKGFQNLRKTIFFKSTRNRYTKNWA